MSYIRYGHKLRYFKGRSNEYVFLSYPIKKRGKDWVEDYDSDYKDDKSFCELIGRFIKIATKDEDYTLKMIKVLAKKLNIEKELRKNPLY